MKAKVFRHAGVGFLIGMIIGFLIGTGRQTGSVVVQMLISGLYGSAAVSGMVLYDVDEWSLAKSTIVHYLIIAVLYVPMALFLGWTESAADILIVECFQLIAFFLIWIIMYLRFKAEVRELNELLKKKKGERS